MLIRIPRPRIIDRYLFVEMVPSFLGGTLFLCFAFLMFQILRLAEFFIVHGVAAKILFEMIGLLVVSFLPTAFPIAFLISVLMTIGRFSADSELIALKANGVSVYRLTAPILLFSVVVAVVTLFLNQQWVPQGEREFKKRMIKVSNTKVVSSINEGAFTSGFFDLLLYADKVDATSNRLKRVFIYDEREAKNPLVVVAKEGEIVSVKTQSELASSIMLKLYDGNVHRNDLVGGTYQKINFTEYRLYLKIDEGEGAASLKPRMLPQEEIVSRRQTLDPKSDEYSTIDAEYWRRYAMAMVPVLFVFLGVGFGSFRTRAIRSGAALVTFLVVFVYMVVQGFTTVGVQRGILPGWFALQIPNLLVGLAGFFSYRTAIW